MRPSPSPNTPTHIPGTTPTYSGPTEQDIAAWLSGMGVIIFVVLLISFIFNLVCYWLLAKKAGYSGAMSLLMFIPFVNIVIMLMYVFAEWPVQREVRTLRAMHGGGGYRPLPPGY